MSDTQTPETDYSTQQLYGKKYVPARVARSLERERNKLREALRDCVWWAECVSRRVTEERESINWTGLQIARMALADIQKEEK